MGKAKNLWIYERSYIRAELALVNFYNKFFRLIKILFHLPKVLFSKNTFSIGHMMGDSSMPSCLVCSREKKRVLGIFFNTLQGYNLFDLKIHRSICIPDLKRLILIIIKSFRYDFYSIIRVAEIYDYNIIIKYNQSLLNFDIYASSDGSTPLIRVMCSEFNKMNKPTVRIVTHGDGPKIDKYFSYNFLLESYKGVVMPGWRLIQGLPWDINIENSGDHSLDFIGFIGAPGGSRVFGIEAWLLLLLRKIQKNGLKIKIRLHPQAYKFSGYLLRLFFDVKMSNEESESEFISSISCLVTSYRSTLIDLALLLNCPVILHSYQVVLKENRNISCLDLRKDFNKCIEICNKAKLKNRSKNISTNKDSLLLAIHEIVLLDDAST